MAKVAVPGSLPSNSLHFGRPQPATATATMKRKTPSELRDEQLKRRSCATTMDALLTSHKITGGTVCTTKRPDTSKCPRYIDTRVDEVFPVRKPNVRSTMLYIQEKAKNKLASVSSILDTKSQPQLACSGTSPSVDDSAKSGTAQTFSMTEKCSKKTFPNVSDISLGFEKSSGSTTTSSITNMEALKTLGAREPPAVSHLPSDPAKIYGDRSSSYLGTFSTESHIPGRKTPLDLTLKTTMKLVSSSSVKWCHRLINSSISYGINHSTSRFSCYGNQKPSLLKGNDFAAVALFSKSLHSWTYPQSSLPPSVISALRMSAAQGDMDFLSKRQNVWEDSFQNLYYMLRKDMCNIFYVCTPQFVVMFTGGDYTDKTKRICNAYVSQSTRGLRSLLREHDISFSMPLCHSEAEHTSAEDLVELSEIEKGCLGQIRRSDSISDVKDHSPQSLLAFSGNESVHGLYDFLLNYRSFLNLLIGGDVPVLCAPVPFLNASISAPEVKCKEIKRASSLPSLPKGSHLEEESTKDLSGGVCHSIEITDTILPPWIISGICASLGSEGRSFEASFTTEPTSIGLNVALDISSFKSDIEIDSCNGLQESSQTFGITEAVISPCLRLASLRGLKFSNDSYKACLMPV
ncbi:hypothetical protein IFM89_000348 [Coptis chinensis]|uniref:Protein downstream neighbor of Son n=1 Tax=Coptis chinensis TaxID=261450 RepID=A0A835H848_9MAGN|nr:hypothetical protein IFM89_000348 [Coptis chinensis]